MVDLLVVLCCNNRTPLSGRLRLSVTLDFLAEVCYNLDVDLCVITRGCSLNLFSFSILRRSLQ